MIFKLTMSLMRDPFTNQWVCSVLLTCLPSDELSNENATPKEFIQKFIDARRAEALAQGFRFVHENTLS